MDRYKVILLHRFREYGQLTMYYKDSYNKTKDFCDLDLAARYYVEYTLLLEIIRHVRRGIS